MELNSCSMCGLQYQQQATSLLDVPVYQQGSDSVKLANRRTCRQCCLTVSHIELFAEQNQLRFCNHSFKSHLFDYYFVDHTPQPKKSVQLLYETSSQLQQRRNTLDNRAMLAKRLSMTQRSMPQENQQPMHPYMTLIIDEILQKNYLTLAHFPKTLQLLAYLACTPSGKEGKAPQMFVVAQERHQKVKNIVLYLAEHIHLSVEELPYVLFIVNFLLCFMNPQKAVSVTVQISNILLAYPHLLSWKTLIYDHQRSQHQTPLSPATIDLRTLLVPVDKLWAKIEAIVDLARRGQTVLREGLIRLSKVELGCEAKEYRKKVGQSLKSLLSKKQDLQLMDDHHLHMLYMLKLQRNGFSLVLKEVMEQEELNRQQIIRLTHKFKLEKDEFIQKIVKLNNKIQTLEQTIKELEEKSKLIPQQSQIKQKQILNQQLERKMELTERQIALQSIEIKLNSIITTTDLFNFNQKHYHLAKRSFQEPPPGDITQKIIIQIQKMEEMIERNASRVKSIEDEKTRLLAIISRKEQRLLAVIMEKDTTIQRYQQALWTMQNGIQVTEGPLVNRIKYIMHIFANRQSTAEGEEVMQVMQEAALKKSKQKDCQIY